MGTTAAPSALTVKAPDGAHFEIEEVATKGGTEKFEAPILVWDTTPALVAHLGEEGVLAMADGTSLRVAYQAAARRGHTKNKSFDEIAQAQVEYKPGKRSGASSTPQNKTARMAKEVVDKNPEAADEVQKLLAAIAAGKFSIDDLKAMNG
jgi:hypothetical protein